MDTATLIGWGLTIGQFVFALVIAAFVVGLFNRYVETLVIKKTREEYAKEYGKYLEGQIDDELLHLWERDGIKAWRSDSRLLNRFLMLIVGLLVIFGCNSLMDRATAWLLR